MHPKHQRQPQGSLGSKAEAKFRFLKYRLSLPLAVSGNAIPTSSPLIKCRTLQGRGTTMRIPSLCYCLQDQSGLKGTGVFLVGCPALAPCTGVPAVAEQGTAKPLCLFQLYKELSSSLPCHMALLLILWKWQRCGGWTRGFSSLNISPARAYAEVLALT